jgi:hypothetical protein
MTVTIENRMTMDAERVLGKLNPECPMKLSHNPSAKPAEAATP